MSTAPGAPNKTVRPGAKIPPNPSPNAQTISPQPTPASPASRADQPRTATIIHSPMPSWIHTDAEAAWMGW
jgi:hypothetical protein